MRIIALEEHIGDRQLGQATSAAINASYPYMKAFMNPNPADAPSVPDLMELGDRRIKELDEAGIDMVLHRLAIRSADRRACVYQNAPISETDKEKLGSLNAKEMLHINL